MHHMLAGIGCCGVFCGKRWNDDINPLLRVVVHVTPRENSFSRIRQSIAALEKTPILHDTYNMDMPLEPEDLPCPNCQPLPRRRPRSWMR